MKLRLTRVATLAALAALPAAAQETIVVTATRLPQAGFDLPAAIDAVDARVIREDNPQVNLSETLNRVPGIVVQNRQNYAQDLQISSRGFGARSTFGVRGVRLIADGIPATMPDGQGQAATFDLASAARIEVLRGPFASLYGNSSGGVVQVFTADGPERPTLDITASGGSYGQRRGHLRFGGQADAFNYLVSASRYETDGFREHSAAVRDQANAKASFAWRGGKLTLVASGLDQPDTQDPLGLTRAQFESDPRQVDASALQFDTRKSIRHAQGGLVYDGSFAFLDSVQARVYSGDRQVEQYLGQAGDGPLASGGVVDLDRTFGGAGLRLSHRFGATRPLTFTVGIDHDRMKERRRGFVNANGHAGNLRRDEDNIVSNTDTYAQAEWTATERLSLSAGARRSTVRFISDDYFFTPANPDDSGRVSYTQTTPVAGIVFKIDPTLNLYANAGKGFETPTFAEIAYRPGGITGINFSLQPARSRHVELGVKSRPYAGLRMSAALFRIETRDEIVTNSSTGGRTDFRNASRTVRRGLELLAEAKLGAGWEAMAAYTALDARFVEPFSAGSPAVVVPAGRKLPGVPRSTLQAELAWRGAPWHAALELRHSSRIYVNDLNTDSAAAFTVANLRAGYEHLWGGWRLREYLRVDNVTDRRYAGSVIVAEARGRFFEPAPGRSWFAGIEASRAF